MATAGRATEQIPAGVLVVRHRQSMWNAEGRWTGQADPPLSAVGEREALALGRTLAPLRFGAIMCSDLARARQTAALVARAMPDVTVTVDARLREIDVPAWSGRTKADIQVIDSEGYARWRSPAAEPPPGAEPWDRLQRRVLDALHSCAELDERVLVVAHAGVLRVLQRSLGVADKIKRSSGLWVHRVDGRPVAGKIHSWSPAD